MRWKEIIIGSIITLIITVLGGIIVWQFTRVPPKPDPEALVVVEADSPARFTSESKNLTFNTIRIGNLGDKVAQNVVLSVEFPEETKISEFSMSSSTGAAARNNYQEISSEINEKIISIDSLLPQESVTVSMISNQTSEEPPTISGRYDEGLVEHGFLSKRGPIEEGQTKGPQALKAAISSLVLGLLLAFMFFRLKSSLGGLRSVNNSAFMLLHNGLVEDAYKMLERNIAEKGASSYEMANLGLCKALAGDNEDYNKYLSAAERYSNSKEIKALVAFNRAIIKFESKDYNASRSFFEKAVYLSRKRIKLYVECSVYATKLAEHFEEFSDLLPSKTNNEL